MSTLVAVCLLAQPVLAMAHDLHEDAHAALAASPAEHAPAGESDHPDDVFHALLHTVDSCAHSSAILGTPLTLTFDPARVLHAPALFRHAPGEPGTRDLRPPISA